jgi:hypothetical protein
MNEKCNKKTNERKVSENIDAEFPAVNLMDLELLHPVPDGGNRLEFHQ